MIHRTLESKLIQSLKAMPVVVILGPRQVGKTTLALEFAKPLLEKPVHYLDLELDSDLAKLDDPENFLRRFNNQLLVIDEVQRKPDLFRIIRGLVDIRKRAGEKAGHFLLLGSASKDLLQQSSESLAGRIRYLELSPFNFQELYLEDQLGFNSEKLWYRGGFPDSYLADSDQESWDWRHDFITTYVEKDIPLFGPQVSATRMKRFWTMLAHFHGQQANLSDIGKSLEVSHTTARTYLDILQDFFMIRQLQPYSGNTKKRLIKSPKIYIRDSGLLHSLLSIHSFDQLLGHPILGASWEGFVAENILNSISNQWKASYYRSSNQSEIDLILEKGNQEIWAVEIKRSVYPTLSSGFHRACEDIGATRKMVVYSGNEQFYLKEKTEVVGLKDFLMEILKEHRP
ncbi:MAG: ATP-binding protein [Cyclobacteriaceae bacterium]|uniref:ATP-binding protein n=1 Tax=Algoriphagus marincola TaxID=264027 RepID=A0ABS7N7N9_9BACT|nr:ATP-binding protein [Algoriphagus marincola]MBY5952350.1 ATP-binding protein [Algoriphagus marincola]MCR9083683.1 ATP-binding protein [Cyclobacteriaceae bacterium]